MALTLCERIPPRKPNAAEWLAVVDPSAATLTGPLPETIQPVTFPAEANGPVSKFPLTSAGLITGGGVGVTVGVGVAVGVGVGVGVDAGATETVSTI